MESFQLFDYQQEALRKMSGRKRCAFYHDMGLGKTFTGSEQMMRIGNFSNLVICQRSKVSDWCDHFSRYYDCAVIDRTRCKKAERPSGKFVEVINYDLIFRRSDLMELQDFTVMFDESSLLQNESSKRTKAAMKLADRADALILLSGTPTDGKYERLWSQLHMLGWGISKKLFWRQYVDAETSMNGQGFPITIVKGYKNEDRLSRKMSELGCDFIKTSDVIDSMPDQRFIDVKSEEIRKTYKKLERNGIVEYAGHEFVGDSTFAFITAARRLCGAFNSEKLRQFAELIESCGDRMVVFYNFDDELNAMSDSLDAMGRSYCTLNSRSHDVSKFNDVEDCVILIQYQSGAMGLNLQAANKMIYFSPPLASSLYEQSKKRIHRIGQKNACMYYRLIAKGTIEEDIYATLAMRHDYTEQLFERSKNG